MNLISSHFIVGWDIVREDIPVIAKEPCYLVGFLVQSINMFVLKDQGVPEVQGIGFAHPS